MRRICSKWVTAIAVAAGLALMASPAAAADDPDPDPVLPRDLIVSALSASPSGSNWSINYTVTNTGEQSAVASTVRINGTNRSVPSLGEGTSHSGTLQLPRTDCTQVISAMADAGRVVVEGSEYNNIKSVVGHAPPCPPRYKIQTVSFKAVNESGNDSLGSDEPYWIFSSVANGGTARTSNSPEFGDVDTGDTRSYFGCIFGCDSPSGELAPAGIGLSIQLWESEQSQVDEVAADIAEWFIGEGGLDGYALAGNWVASVVPGLEDLIDIIGGYLGDDLLGSQTYAYSADHLATRLPAIGGSFLDTRHYTADGCYCDYVLTTKVTRSA